MNDPESNALMVKHQQQKEKQAIQQLQTQRAQLYNMNSEDLFLDKTKSFLESDIDTSFRIISQAPSQSTQRNPHSKHPSASSTHSSGIKPVRETINFGFSEGVSTENNYEGGRKQGEKAPIYFKGLVDYQFRKHPRQEVSPTIQLWLRVAAISTFIIVAFILAIYSLDMTGESVHGVKDLLFLNTAGLNQYFRDDQDRRDILLIVGSGFLDIMVLVQFYRFVRYSTTWRLIMAFIVFYSLRFVVQKLWYVEFPEGYDWGYPGFFSLFVPYGQTADFFYSGHLGVCMLNFLEFWAVGWNFMAVFSFLTMILQFFLMIALRSHYTMDMTSGIIFAHYFWILSEKYSYLVDWHIFSIPLEKRQAKNRGFNKEQIQNQLTAQGKSNIDALDNYINYPGGGIGSYFISCRNCQAPIHTHYMTCEQDVIHISNMPADRRRYEAADERDSNQQEGGQYSQQYSSQDQSRHPLDMLNN